MSFVKDEARFFGATGNAGLNQLCLAVSLYAS